MRKYRKRAPWPGLLAAALAASGFPVSIATADPQADAALATTIEGRIEEILRGFQRKAEFPSASVGYSLPDGTNRSVSVGLADKARCIPMRADHRMMAGSTGKTFFAALALQLVDEGVLDLDRKISAWLGSEPWFGRLPNANAITFRMLLNHTTGIPRYVMLPAFVKAMQEDPGRRWEPVELLFFVFDREPLFPAGEGWGYADTNFIVAGLIIEKVTGDSVESRCGAVV